MKGQSEAGGVKSSQRFRMERKSPTIFSSNAAQPCNSFSIPPSPSATLSMYNSNSPAHAVQIYDLWTQKTYKTLQLQVFFSYQAYWKWLELKQTTGSTKTTQSICMRVVKYLYSRRKFIL